ncbi:MAG: DUF3365 domain-containing protein [Planctomycetes bacterium]|jgi:hypothetical protein|nr:DUF3365 domain-containing protein [Planctomycetota bacterium]
MPALPRLLAVPLLWAAACSSDPTTADPAPAAPPWPQVAAAALAPAQQAQLAHADRARGALAQRLLGELTKAIDTHGTRAAISVCKVRAPELAAEVAAEHGVRLGRTSHRLRSPDNRPPGWAKTALGGDDAPKFFAGPAGEFGVLQPILLQPMCVQCHGQPDQLAEGVTEALQRLYPDDRATGFAAGERRGWFWIEVPKAP